jgi:hypothetical protein
MLARTLQLRWPRPPRNGASTARMNPFGELEGAVSVDSSSRIAELVAAESGDGVTPCAGHDRSLNCDLRQERNTPVVRGPLRVV